MPCWLPWTRCEATGLLTPGSHWPMLTSDPLGPAPADGKLTYANCWSLANSQEFDQVSPAMWKEFLLDYQMPILERFGLVGYGCCENLTKKIDGVLLDPEPAHLRLQRLDEPRHGDRAGRPQARDHVAAEGQRRRVPRRRGNAPPPTSTTACSKLQGHHVQIVLRELQTLAGHPDRLHVWTRLAIEAAERYA